MARDLSQDTDRALAESRSLLHDNRAGGRHRRALSQPIGRGSAELKAKHLANKLVQLAVGVVGVLVAAGVVGAIIGGIGFWGVMCTVLAIGAVIGVSTGRGPLRSAVRQLLLGAAAGGVTYGIGAVLGIRIT